MELGYKHTFAFVSFRGIVEETPNTTEHGRPSVMLEKYASATKMQPQSSGSLRSNAGIEKGKEIAARLNVHRIHSQLRGLDSTGRFHNMTPLFVFLCPISKLDTLTCNLLVNILQELSILMCKMPHFFRFCLSSPQAHFF